MLPRKPNQAPQTSSLVVVGQNPFARASALQFAKDQTRDLTNVDMLQTIQMGAVRHGDRSPFTLTVRTVKAEVTGTLLYGGCVT